MAEKIVSVSVRVSDDGTMRLTEKSAKRLQGSLQGVGVSAATADRSLKGAAAASSNTTKNFSKMAQGITGGLVPAYATLAANVFAVTALFGFLKDAGDLRALQEGQVAYASTTGVALGVLTEDLRKAAGGLLTFKDAAQAAAIGVASGLQGSQLEELAAGAANVSKILGRDVTDSFNRLVKGVTKAEPELLDELGITLRLADAKEKYATALGKSANALTLAEQKQAVFLEVSTQLEDKFSRINEILAPENNSFTELGVAFDDALKAVKSLVEEFASPVAKFFTGNINSLIAVLGLFAIPIIRSIIPSLENWREVTAESTAKVIEDIEEAQQRINEITAKKADIAPGSPQEVAQGIAGKVKARKGSGLEALQQQRQLSERQIKGIIKSLEGKTKTFVNLSEKEKIVLKRNLQLMLADVKKTNLGILQSWKNTFTNAGLSVQQFGRQAEVVFLRIKALAIQAAGFITKWAGRLLSIVSGIGLITLALDLLKTGVKAVFGDATNKALQDQAKDIENIVNRQKDLIKEYQKLNLVQEELLKKTALGSSQFAVLGNVIDATTKNFDELNKAILIGNNALTSTADAFGITNSVARSLLDTFDSVAKVFDFTDSLEASEQLVKAGQEALKQYAETGKLVISVLRTLGLDANDTFKEFATLNLIVASGTALTKEQQERYLELAQTVGQQAALFGGLTQRRLADNRAFDQGISSITQFTTKSKELLDTLKERLKDEKNLRKELAQAGGNLQVQDDIIARLERQIQIQEELRKQEVKLAIQKKFNELQSLKNSRGAYDFEKKRASITRSINDIKAQETDIYSKILLAQNSGAKIDFKKIQDLYLQLNILKQQRLALEDQVSVAKQLQATIKSSLESGLSTNLADLIKGNEASLGDAVAKIAKGVFESVADVLAQDMAEKILSGIGLFKSPAQKMYNALQAGGDYIKRKIQEGFGTDTSGTAVPTAGGPPDPTGAASEGTQKAGFFEKLFGKKVAVEASPDSEAISTTNKGTPVVADPGTTREGGIFGPFLNSFSDIFDKNTEGGFLAKLGTSFGDLLGGFGGLFKQLPSLLGGLFGGAGGGLGAIFGGLFGFASGGIMPGGMKGYANGGVVNKPTLGMIGEGKMNEAVVPLPDGKSIPVVGAGGSQQNNISISVNMASDGSSNAQSSGRGDNQGRELGRVISAAVQEELQRQKRPGGILSPYGVA